jgi:hypothetical protein
MTEQERIKICKRRLQAHLDQLCAEENEETRKKIRSCIRSIKWTLECLTGDKW